jgi:hypothetical protein
MGLIVHWAAGCGDLSFMHPVGFHTRSFSRGRRWFFAGFRHNAQEYKTFPSNANGKWQPQTLLETSLLPLRRDFSG